MIEIIAAIAAIVWAVGFAATLIFALERLRINVERGLIANPDSLSGFLHLIVMSIIWPYTMAIYWREARASKR